MEERIKAELLAPAGSYAKLMTALHFGADAVYVGGKNFSLRTFADNFTEDELSQAVAIAHELGKKVYVTANIFAKNADFGRLTDYFQFLNSIGADAAIISDPGVVYAAKKAAPTLPIHLSTQANTTNKYAVKFWQEQGLSRVILARELSLGEISEIHEFVPDMELEAFVHGAMCISYSGRCLLSDYLDGRSSNRGACVQSCRWRYEVRALNATNGQSEWLPIEQDEKGTYIFNSKDLNMLSLLREMEQSGVCSFKIEGRMKSGYYLATVINAYRRAMNGEEFSVSETELFNVAHRDYTQAYAQGNNSQTVNYADSQSKGDYTYIADVVKSENGYVFAEMRNRFRAGDILEVLSPDSNFAKTFEAEEIFDSKNENTEDAKLVQEVYKIKCPYNLKKGDYLRRKISV
ncbi:MAG: U32 family peptidase C-terminal domain-containing protein [Clostridia bacterium]|nr:U32 family peptidase C-terminal domain-containing protein [Clostridia bacterium]